MLTTLRKYSNDKNYRDFAWALYSGYKDGSLTLRDYADITIHYFREQYIDESNMGGLDIDYLPGEYHDPWDVASECGTYAALFIYKGILDGKWQLSESGISSDRDFIGFDELCDVIPEYTTSDHDCVIWFRQMIDVLRDFDQSKISMFLAPLQNCTHDNILAAMSLMSMMTEFYSFGLDMDDLAKLRQFQVIWPEGHTVSSLIRAVRQDNETTYAFFFLETADSRDHYYERIAYERLINAESIEDVIIAASELDFSYMNHLIFPYSLYVLLSGYEPDQEAPDEQ